MIIHFVKEVEVPCYSRHKLEFVIVLRRSCRQFVYDLKYVTMMLYPEGILSILSILPIMKILRQ